MLLLAYVAGAFGLAMFGQANFLVPLRARELGATFDIVGLIIAVGALTPAILSVPIGALIDRLGPRRSMLLGCLAAAGTLSIHMLATSYWALLAVQPFVGISITLGWVSAQSYITSLGTPADRPRLTGRFGFFANVGQMVGPLLSGGAAQVLGFRWGLLAPVAYALVFAGVALALIETRSEAERDNRVKQGTGARAALGLLALRGVQVALLLTFVRLWIGFTFNSFFPVFLVESGIQPGMAGVVTATFGFTGALIAPTTGWLTRFASQQSVVWAGLTCGAVGLLLAPHVPFLPVVFIVPVLLGIGAGVSLPLLISIVTTAAPAELRGVALGLRSMVNQGAGAAAPLLVGSLIAAVGMTLGFTVGGVIAGVVAASARVLHAFDRPVPDDRAGT